jgi:uncharacterized membrane protein
MPTARIEAFSDGVFAIVITLLILSIAVPKIHGDPRHELGPALRALLPKFLSYALSFGIICVWWVAHNRLFVLLAKSDRGLLWLNSLFLFWLASVPFPTALLGDYPLQRVAVVAYGGVMVMAGISFTTMRYYAFYVGRLTAPGTDPGLMRDAMRKSVMNPVLHLIAILLAWVDTRISLAFYVGIPLLFFLPSRLEQAAAPDRALS